MRRSTGSTGFLVAWRTRSCVFPPFAALASLSPKTLVTSMKMKMRLVRGDGGDGGSQWVEE